MTHNVTRIGFDALGRRQFGMANDKYILEVLAHPGCRVGVVRPRAVSPGA